VYLDLDAEQARSALLGPLWSAAVDVWRDIDAIRRIPAARRLLDAGADPDDVSRALRAAALDAVFATLSRIDAGGDPSGGDPSGGDLSGGDLSGGDLSGGDLSGGDPAGDPAAGGVPIDAGSGWQLVRTGPDGRPTATVLADLHAALLGHDPSGLAGVELRR